MNVITVFHRAGTWLVVYKSVCFNNFLACWPAGSKKNVSICCSLYSISLLFQKMYHGCTYLVRHQDAPLWLDYSPEYTHYCHSWFIMSVPWLRCLVAGLSPFRSTFIPRPVHVGYVVAGVTWQQVFLRVLPSSPVDIIPPVLHALSFIHRHAT
jgi:hypothetical protein